jgi:hypothetical protein
MNPDLGTFYKKTDLETSKIAKKLSKMPMSPKKNIMGRTILN